MPRRPITTTPIEMNFPALINQSYFSDYFLSYRLDTGLSDLYQRWDTLERQGEPTARTKTRALSSTFNALRPTASLTTPEAESLLPLETGALSQDAVTALRELNEAILQALGWGPHGNQSVTLTSGRETIHIPAARSCETPAGLLLLVLETVFASDPGVVVSQKDAAAGALLEPVCIGDRAEGLSVLEAAQIIFLADAPPRYLLVCSGGSITLLDRERWGEGAYLAANLDDAISRNDTRPRGELATIAALFSEEVINPHDDAQSVLANLVDKATKESAGVSKELRHGVRHSVELLANAVIDDIRTRQNGAWRTIDPEELSRQCLRYLYRIIVLLFAEARPELGILPVNDPDYQSGYSLSRLREIALTELHSDLARNSTHLQQSLSLLFRLVNNGYEPPTDLYIDRPGLSFPSLASTLFEEDACRLLDRSRISDETLQQVLANLCFTKEIRGRSREVLSYATLGINQLGAVYEGIMAYKGFLATQDLFQIAKDGDPEKGSWVIPVERANDFSPETFVMEVGIDGQDRRIRYLAGSFVFRLSGSDRKRSASYYTPEVLTEFTVRHTLDVYFNEHPDIKPAEILRVTICEPALGSGAFLSEAISQLGARYLKAAQAELGEILDANSYQLELQKVKAHFAINQSYGVDLNSTAIELAEVSLWLNCMYPGLSAPHFEARLRRGNSLIGARRATYSLKEIERQPWKSTKSSRAFAPTDHPLHEVPLGEAHGIHHFLLPGEGWGAAADAVELKGKGGANPQHALAQSWSTAVKDWRKEIHRVPSKVQLHRLEALSIRVEAAWASAAKHATEYLHSFDQTIEVWGTNNDDLPNPGIASTKHFLWSEGPTARLKLLMDAWCALWMWSPANGIDLPNFDNWLCAAEELLGQQGADEIGPLFALDGVDETILDPLPTFGKVRVRDILVHHPWLVHCQTIARSQGFFHWELELATVFLRGGFDIQVGNPPWVRPTWDEDTTLAEHDPWWGITDLTKTRNDIKEKRKEQTLLTEVAVDTFLKDRSENEGLNALLSAPSREPTLSGIQNNLYMVFMTNTWRRANKTGSVGLLHPESHFVDPKAGVLRAQTYRRLRRHWQFTNELFLFPDVHHETDFGVHIYAGSQEVRFLQASNILTPSTIDRSLAHDGSGELPSIQFAEGGWDLRPHASRIITVEEAALRDWVELFDEPGTPWSESRLLLPLTQADLGALHAFAIQSSRLGSVTRYWTRGFDEDKLKSEGTGAWHTATPPSQDDCILQGPHIVNGTPFAQQPRPNCQNNTDWEPVDLEALPENFIPRTNYQRLVGFDEFLRRQTTWGDAPYTTRYREAHREFVGAGSVRTLQSCILPPRVVVVGSMVNVGASTNLTTVYCSGILSSLPYDYLVKVSGVKHIKKYVTDSLPIPASHAVLDAALLLRTLRLNCVTSPYAPLWSELFDASWTTDHFVAGDDSGVALGNVVSQWSIATPLRTDYDRWLALCEIDAIVSLLLGLSEDQLIQMYRSQFAVLRKYESAMVFDGNGRQISGYYQAYGFAQAKWEAELLSTRTRQSEKKMWKRVQAYEMGDTQIDLGPFVAPFRPADREAAMRRAFQAFAKRIEAQS